ncbi:unnamed protein product [Echinostoma caproni]|uniref:DNA-directed RNA polymerase n=1 Tax=Echinostoma caproni TaxID=27848 RepID=A0A183AYN2_9TREM|nr:unnamed protein product [Echinostoma caproni]
MSVALGQIELEGRRVPLMLSGRSLPSFPPYDVRPRAGGMCTHRFLTSLPPQELFFHSMAGRDGLVDTAVKTSRSGYLQRSAIKHLEDLSIQYDGTVRDSGNNVIQFRYGDDGVDVCQSSFLQQAGMNMFADNATLFNQRWQSSSFTMDDPSRARLIEQCPLPRPLQTLADMVGVQRETVRQESIPHRKIVKLLRKARRAAAAFNKASEEYKQLSRSEVLDNDLVPPPPCDTAADVRQLCLAKLISAQAPPGEPVGLLAAQSVGEPSTQMTLNTFHFAGRGEMNVTLGIPRLREILMSGSAQTSTPCMEVPVLPSASARRNCMQIAKRMYKLKLVETIKLPIGEKVDYASDSCTLEFQLLPRSAYSERSHIKPTRVLRFLERVLFSDLARRLDHELRDQGKTTNHCPLNDFYVQCQKHWKTSIRPWPLVLNPDSPFGILSQAIRRRRMEAEAEDEPAVGGHLTRNQIIDLDEAIDDVEDDAEVAELRELGVDPERIRDEEDDVSETEGNDRPEGASNLKNSNTLPGKSPIGAKTAVTGSKDAKDDTGLLDEMDVQANEDDAELPLEDVDKENGNKADEDLEMEYESRRTMFDPKEGRISIDLKTLVTRIVNRSVVSSVSGIEKIIVDKSNQSEWMFRVEGVNMIEMMRYPDVFDLSRLYTNNICVMSQTYGIEAARASIQKEVSSVFGHYGISVNPRHLSLIADYMTKSGTYRAFNRLSFRGHPSPLQQMSFETVSSALKATIQDVYLRFMPSNANRMAEAH